MTFLSSQKPLESLGSVAETLAKPVLSRHHSNGDGGLDVGAF
jgi:hypothetical protein